MLSNGRRIHRVAWLGGAVGAALVATPPLAVMGHFPGATAFLEPLLVDPGIQFAFVAATACGFTAGLSIAQGVVLLLANPSGRSS
jgi:hypothetical protein